MIGGIMFKLKPAITVTLLMALLAFSSGSSVADSQTGEQIHNLTISVAGGRGSSASYGASLTVGQTATGACGSANFGVHQGLWQIIAGGGGGGGCCHTPGDANDDATVNIGDAVYLINYIFKGGPPPPCMDAGDANCDAAANIGDAVYLVNFIFKGGPPPCCP